MHKRRFQLRSTLSLANARAVLHRLADTVGATEPATLSTEETLVATEADAEAFVSMKTPIQHQQQLHSDSSNSSNGSWKSNSRSSNSANCCSHHDTSTCHTTT